MWISRILVLEKLSRSSKLVLFIMTLALIITKLIRKIIRICNEVYFMILILGLKYIQIGAYE